MIVVCKNENGRFELNMPFLLFESIKRCKPRTIVDLLEVTQSSYKKEIHVEIADCEDYSVARNTEALNN